MPRTLRAADRAARACCSPEARRSLGDLRQALAAVECHFAVSGPTGVPAELLRDLVIFTTTVAGRTWLHANAQDVAGFTALHIARWPPPLPDLDQILAAVLSHRFREAQRPASESRAAVVPPGARGSASPASRGVSPGMTEGLRAAGPAGLKWMGSASRVMTAPGRRQ